MKVKVNQDKCIGCGTCPSLVPDVFDFNDEGLAHAIVDEVPGELEDEVKETIKACPVEAIYEVKEEE